MNDDRHKFGVFVQENGLTLAEELEILEVDKNDQVSGPFDSTKELIKFLQSN